MVVWSHAFSLGGLGADPVSRLSRELEDTGSLAVDGFFLLSGFLITRSFERTGQVGRFIWHRVLRIFPAFWVCLAVVAFGFAPIAFWQQHGSLAGFLTSTNPPASYVTNNALLAMNQYNIGGLLATVPYPFLFNHSLWTLQYEFYCYLAVAILGAVALAGRRRAFFLLPLVACFVLFAVSSWARTHGVPLASRVLELFTFFSFGACAYLFRERVPIRGWIALLCAAGAALSLPTRAYGAVLPIALSYLTIFAAAKLPIRDFDRRIDLSYGLYIYAFPIQQLLVLFGVAAFGFGPYFAVAYLLSLGFAMASWFTVEKRSLSLKNLTVPWWKPVVQTNRAG